MQQVRLPPSLAEGGPHPLDLTGASRFWKEILPSSFQIFIYTTSAEEMANLGEIGTELLPALHRIPWLTSLHCPSARY